MSDKLSKSILKTVCYYDVLNYPLTLFEIWKYLIGDKKTTRCSLSLIKEELNSNNNLKAFIKSKDGFYFLKGREKLVTSRIRSDKIAVTKIKRLRSLIYILRMSPFVRAIFVTGRLAMKNAQYGSDWDVLVVLKKGRIWIGRTFITILSHLLFKRRHHKKIKDRICLNYFVTTESLEIRNKDLFSAGEYFACIPIFDTNNFFKKFQLKNGWIKNYKANYFLSELEHLKKVSDGAVVKKIRNILEKVLDSNGLEKYFKKIELKKIKKNPNTAKENSFIVADDEALIFLPNPQGPKVFEKFKERVAEL